MARRATSKTNRRNRVNDDEAVCSICEYYKELGRFRYENELKAIEKRSFTTTERRSFVMQAQNTMRRAPETKAELIRSLLMLHVLEAS